MTYYAEHRAERLAYYADNRAERLAYQARYRAENREKILAGQARWRAENRPLRLADRARYRHRRRTVPTLPITPEQLAGKLAYWGGLCWVCRTALHEHWDHVKPLSRGGAHILANLRPACATCNISKNDRWKDEKALPW